jgi:hypothetical protein
MRQCKVQQPLASTSMVHGKIAGNRSNVTPKAAVGPLSAVRFPTTLSTIYTSVPPGNSYLTRLSSIGVTGCSRICTKRRRQLVAPAYTEISALPRNRDQSGGESSRASSNPRQRLPSKLRWRPKRQSKFTGNDRRSPSSRMPGSKSDVDSGNFDAGDKKRH